MLAALLCIASRAFLNVCDRHVLKKTDADLFKNIALNSIFPFFVALAVTCLFTREHFFEEYLFHPGVMLSALGAQLAGCILALSFSKMPVKGVVISSKMADLFIPLLIACITNKFILADYIFSSFSVLIFIPVVFPLEKTQIAFRLKTVLAIVLVLVFQAGINSYFCIGKCADTLPRFFSLMTCIIFWRAMIMLAVCLIKSLHSHNEREIAQTGAINYFLLLFRALISFLSSAAFFYAITRPLGNLAWPILNATPLVSCITAHFVLQERVGKTEMGVLGVFTAVTLFYAWL